MSADRPCADAPVITFAALLRAASDAEVRAPLWEFEPLARLAVIHERRRRFGVDDDEGFADVG